MTAGSMVIEALIWQEGLQLLTRDTGNENEVGEGIRDSGVPRKDIFITSKLWNSHQPNVKEGLQKTLDALGTDYLDLYVSCVPCPNDMISSRVVVATYTDSELSLSIGQFDLFL